MINIEILENGNEIRKKFIEKFTATWEEFQVLHKDWIDDCAQRNEVFEYDELYLWDKCSIKLFISVRLLNIYEA